MPSKKGSSKVEIAPPKGQIFNDIVTKPCLKIQNIRRTDRHTRWCIKVTNHAQNPVELGTLSKYRGNHPD